MVWGRGAGAHSASMLATAPAGMTTRYIRSRLLAGAVDGRSMSACAMHRLSKVPHLQRGLPVDPDLHRGVVAAAAPTTCRDATASAREASRAPYC